MLFEPQHPLDHPKTYGLQFNLEGKSSPRHDSGEGVNVYYNLCENKLSLIVGHEGEAGLRKEEHSLGEVHKVARHHGLQCQLDLFLVILKHGRRMFYGFFQLSFSILEAILLIFSALEEGALLSILFHYQFGCRQFDSHFFS